MTLWLRHYRIHIILLTALIAIAGVFLLPPIAQDLAYHNFADKRAWLGIANFGDVAGNAPFILLGVLGLHAVYRQRGGLAPMECLIWMTFFVGAFLTGFGSGYYHLSPDNHTLVWDRLPMTIAFMSLFSALVMERVSRKAGVYLFPVLLAAGFFSVWYWNYTEALSRGDLRPYALIQFLPLLEIILILALFPATRRNTRYLIYTLGCYTLAKVLEHFDPQVFALLGHAVSGHTLKHLAAAGGVWWVMKYMQGDSGKP